MAIFWNKTAFFLLALMFLAERAAAQGTYSVLSPNKQIELRIRVGERIQYDVLLRGTVLLQNSTFSIDIDRNTLGLKPKVKASKERSYDGMLEPPVRQKFAKIREHYNESRSRPEEAGQPGSIPSSRLLLAALRHGKRHSGLHGERFMFTRIC